MKWSESRYGCSGAQTSVGNLEAFWDSGGYEAKVFGVRCSEGPFATMEEAQRFAESFAAEVLRMALRQVEGK